ncbi:MAG: heavy metal translocating P-type ATPase [Planctomycetaceae bacterium]|nr:heavy metal translocating P-type ATPase [Planctomycetaceae bacterium]
MKNRIALRIDELDCAEEVVQLRDLLDETAGITQLDFDVVNRRMYVTIETDGPSESEIIERIARIGMHATPAADRPSAETRQTDTSWKQHARLLLTVVAGFAVIAAFVVHAIMTGELTAPLHSDLASPESVPPLPARVLYSLSIVLGFWFVVPKAWMSLTQLRADMNLLMCVAVAGALLLSQWLEAAMVTFLFQVSLLLEHWSMDRARHAVNSLLKSSPETARHIAPGNDHPHERPVEEVDVGDRIAIHPGDRIPLDGIVRTGESEVDQSPITGESIHVAKSIGSEVFAGTINGSSSLEVEVTHKAGDTTIDRIIHLVQEAQATRAPAEQWVERFARYYTPAMMLLAILVAIVPPLLMQGTWTTWFYNSLVLLVIACPCALVISTPVSVVSALTAAAHEGVLVKGSKYLEVVAQIKVIALDKTGTLTQGQPVVQSVTPLNEHSRAELLVRAAAMESQSTHPIAKAILDYAESEGVRASAAAEYRLLTGRGAEAEVAGRKYWIGSRRLMHERMPDEDLAHTHGEELEGAGHSVVVIGSPDHVCGLISLADTVRDESVVALREMKRLGIRHTVMLTGDNNETARAIAELVGVDDYFAECLPEDKVRQIERLRGAYGSVAMIGDGVNDSPAMAAANVGIAMGTIGSDAAIETADIALMSDDLSKVSWLVRLARRTLRTIKQNIAFALGLKILFVVLSAVGMASLWLAIAADTGASLLVVFNGMRLLRNR